MRKRSRLLAIAALVVALAANWAVARPAGAMTTTTRAPAARSSLSPAAQRDLVRLFAANRGIPVADIAGIVPAAVLGPRANAGRDWAMVNFGPTARAPEAVDMRFQDGAGIGVFTKSAGHSWTMAGIGGTPAGCGVSIPKPVRSAWHLASCQSASPVPAITRAPKSAAAGTISNLVSIALAQVGVADNPASTNFSDDCNPYTSLVGNPDGAASCGTTTSNGSWFSNSENINEEWCADFTKWVWEKAGVTSDLSALTPGAASFYTWGENNGENITFNNTPAVGDAVVFYPPSAGVPSGSGADHVGIVASINSDGSLNLIDGDFAGTSNISVQSNTGISSAATLYGPGENWTFVSPQLSSGSGAAPALTGFLTPSGALYVKEGGLSAAWTQEEASGVVSFALASDGSNGPLIGIVTSSGAFYVKEGGLSAAWVQEEASGVASIALAIDGKNGPLIGFDTSAGAFYVKEGGLSAAWTREEASGVASIALASDGNGPLIGFDTSSGAFYVKEGGLSAAWTREEASGVASIALANDDSNGPLIGFDTSAGAFYVKEGGLSAAWTQEEASGVASIALASDSTNGPLIGFETPAGAFYVKEGGLSAAWTREEASGVASIALASDGSNGPLIGFETPAGAFYAKEGGLSAAWVQEEASGVGAIALAPSSGD